MKQYYYLFIVCIVLLIIWRYFTVRKQLVSNQLDELVPVYTSNLRGEPGAPGQRGAMGQQGLRGPQGLRVSRVGEYG
jgi:hypothetical protein